MQYSFDESADKGVKVFDLTGAGVENLQDVPLTKGRKLIRLETDGVQDGLALLAKYPDGLVELKLILSEPLTSADHLALAANENLVSLLVEVRAKEEMELQSRKNLSDEELFDAFYKATYGAEPKEELKTLFLQALSEAQEK